MKLQSLVITAAVLQAAAVFAGSPKISATYPAAAQRGTEQEVTFTGTNLDDAKGVLFDEPGFETTLVSATKTTFVAKIKAPADARVGEHSFRVITASGLSDVRLFFVTPYPLVQEVEDLKAPAAVQPVAPGTTVYGRAPNDDSDRFSVDLKKGERLGVEVIGVRLITQTMFDPCLSILGPNGESLAKVDDCALTQQDPVASIIAPADGKYTVVVKDATDSGGGACNYLVNIGRFPRPLVAYPLGGLPGENLKLKLLGDASGPIERTVKLPEKPVDRLALFAEPGEPTPQPNFIRVSQLPNVFETEPNNTVAEAASPAPLAPLAFNGIIEKKGDVDFFKFTAEKDTDYDLRVFARQLRSPLDSNLDIFDAKGARLGGNDDAPGPDSYLRWKAPASGEFIIGIRDQMARGGPTFAYRVEITRVQPKIAVYIPEVVLNQNQDRRAVVVPMGNRYASLVRVRRQDVGGAIRLEPSDLPDGVSAHVPVIDKSVDTVPVVFEATPEAAIAAQQFTFGAQPAEPPKAGPVPSEIEHLVDITENGNQRSYYTIKQEKLPIAITGEIPVKLELVPPKSPLLQGGSLTLHVRAERKDGFKGPVTMDLLHVPPGLGTAGTVSIKEGENEGRLIVSAKSDAPEQKWPVCIAGSADFGRGPVWFSTQMAELEVGAPFVVGQIARASVLQGETAAMTVKLDQKLPFDGGAKLQLVGLPPGATADEQEITKDTTEVIFHVKTAPNTPPGTHQQLACQFALQRNGELVTTTFASGGILRVDKVSLAKNQQIKK